MALNYVDLFHESFARVTKAEDFFKDFYDTFFGSSKEVAAKFEGTDMAVQGQMLALALIHMAAFFSSGEPSATLQRIAERHSKTQRNIEARWYDDWMEALVATVRTHDAKLDEDAELAWRVILAPGIAYMKFYDDDPRAM